MTGSLEGVREVERFYLICQIVSCAWLVTVLGSFGWKCWFDGLSPTFLAEKKRKRLKKGPTLR